MVLRQAKPTETSNEGLFVPPIVIPIALAVCFVAFISIRAILLITANKMIPDDSDDDLLARNMIEVHGAEAPTIARGNARSAALAGQATQAKSWIRVLGIIQRRLAGRAPPPPSVASPPEERQNQATACR
jgi:hypothetical protein